MEPLKLDYRVGSGDLAPSLKQLKIPVEVTKLEFGDAAVVGRGPEGRPVLVGVEVKKVGDLIQSLRDYRLTDHQLPGMMACYEKVHLLVEGIWSSSPRGELLATKGVELAPPPFGEHPWSYQEFANRLNTLKYRHGVVVDYTADRRGTAAWLAALWHWWRDKPWEAHESFLGMKEKTLEASDPLMAAVAPPCIKMRVAAALLKGIGYHRARAIADYFPSVRAMMNAEVKEWAKVDGIGTKIAARVVAEIGREE